MRRAPPPGSWRWPAPAWRSTTSITPRALLAEAVAAAPEWAAAHFEHGKYWLPARRHGGGLRGVRPRLDAACPRSPRRRQLGRAPSANSTGPRRRWRRSRGRSTRSGQCRRPSTTSAWSARELGRLAESEAAFRRVIALTPDLAFGHYNLGHTLFLQGRYQAVALGLRRRSTQATRPATRYRPAAWRWPGLATGDAAGALSDLQRCTVTLPRDYRRQLLSDTHDVALALLSTSPDLRDWRLVGDWLTAELAKS